MKTETTSTSVSNVDIFSEDTNVELFASPVPQALQHIRTFYAKYWWQVTPCYHLMVCSNGTMIDYDLGPSPNSERGMRPYRVSEDIPYEELIEKWERLCEKEPSRYREVDPRFALMLLNVV